MAYLVDELDGQKSVLDLIPRPLWTARPPTDPRSLLDMYGAMLEAECGAYRDQLGLPSEKPASSGDPLQLIDRLAEARRNTVEGLRALPADDFPLETCFHITQADAEALRDVGLRLHEAGLGKLRVTQG